MVYWGGTLMNLHEPHASLLPKTTSPNFPPKLHFLLPPPFRSYHSLSKFSELSMPGTIQVSVLGFMDDLVSFPISPLSLNLAVGKVEYQTRDTGDFSFRLMSLRDDLIVSLRNDEGKEVSRTDIQTKTVVEKGVWDDVFVLNESVRVHMKLQFILSEDERRQIQDMRESALKKKRGNQIKRSLTSSEAVDAARRIKTASSFSSPNLREEVKITLPKSGTTAEELYASSATDGSKSATSTADVSQSLISQPLKFTNAKLKDSIRSQQRTLDWPKLPPPGDRSIPSISSASEESKPTKSEVKGLATISQTSVKNIINAFEGNRSKGVRNQDNPIKAKSSMKEGSLEHNYAVAHASANKEKEDTNTNFTFAGGYQREADVDQISRRLKPFDFAERSETAKSQLIPKLEITLAGEQVGGQGGEWSPNCEEVSMDDARTKSMLTKSEVGHATKEMSFSSRSSLLGEGVTESRSSDKGHPYQSFKDEESKQERRLMSSPEKGLIPVLREVKRIGEVTSSTCELKVDKVTKCGDSGSMLEASTCSRDERIDQEIAHTNNLNFQTQNRKQNLTCQSGSNFHLLEDYNSLLIQDETRHFCLTSVTKKVRKFIDGSFLNSEAEAEPEEEDSLILQEKPRITSPDKSINSSSQSNLNQPRVRRSKDSSADIGRLVEQALNIALIVVCGSLFISTARRKIR